MDIRVHLLPDIMIAEPAWGLGLVRPSSFHRSSSVDIVTIHLPRPFSQQ